jgi:shikimate dehydrogenase
MTIGGATRLVGLIGSPGAVAPSLSPRMQNAAFAALALDWTYVPLPVDGARLDAAIRGLPALGFAGANVTIPHKAAVHALCDVLDPFAERAGSVNTLVVREGRVVGATTDPAILDGIAAHRAVVIGGGGAARALAAALGEAGAEVRTFERRGSWPPEAAGAELVINATPVVDDPLVDVQARQVVVDLPYRPDGAETALAAAARAAGCRLVTGLEALVRQGAASFEQWTGIAAPAEVMRRAIGLHP